MTDPLKDAANELPGLIAAGDFERAETLLTRLAAAFPQDFAVWNNLGAMRDQLDRPTAAVAAYERATALRPNLAAGHYNLALALKRCGRMQDALDAYDRALACDPENPAVHINLGAALVEVGHDGRAFPVLRRAVELAPDSSIAWFNFGLAARKIGRPREGARCFERVLAMEPGHVEATHELGESLLASGRHDTALDCFCTVLAARLDGGISPDNTPRKPASGMGTERARLALFTVADALQHAGVEFVLSAGTALGCVRDQDFIAHDNDIDLCALPGTDPALITGAFDRVDELRVEAIEYQRDELLRVVVGHEQGARTDVFLYHAADDGWWYGIERGDEALAWIDRPFEPRPVRFHGREFLLPYPAERYLEDNYGPDWRIPNPWHVAGFTAHNIRNDYCSFPRSIGYALISRSLRDGLHAAARYYTDVALSHEPDVELLQRAQAQLRP